jgi:hypothetical protein
LPVGAMGAVGFTGPGWEGSTTKVSVNKMKWFSNWTTIRIS